MLACAMRHRLPAGLAGFALIALLAGCTNEHAPLQTSSPCPPWVEYPSDPHSNDNSPYLGCTNRANLEQMVDDKHDLTKGRALGPANGERESNAVKAYEEGKTKTTSTGASGPAPAILLPGSNSGMQQ